MNRGVATGFSHFTDLNPSAVAVVDSHGTAWSREKLWEASNRFARALRSAGLRPGDAIAIFAPNCIEYLQAYFAATQIGLYVVSINPHLSRAEIVHILADAGAKALFAHSRFNALIRAAMAAQDAAPALRISCGSIQGFISIDEFCRDHSAEEIEDQIPGRVLTYTSATTGRPKGVNLPLGDAQKAVDRIIQAHISNGILPGNDNVHLCASTLYHAAPLEWSAISLHMGHKVVLVDSWDAEQLLLLIESHQVTTTFVVPAMLIRMLKLPASVRSQYSSASLRFVAHGAAPCPVEVKRQMIEWWGPIIWEAYGASEGSGTIVNSQEWLKYPGTVGRPFSGSRIKVLDENGVEVPVGTRGIVYLTRYTGDRFEYRGDPEKTREAYRGEFFTVGDIGYLNEAGYLFLCDRKIDLIICGGMNIYPAEIEQILVQHPRVADCAVFGVPDELMGEAVRAVVEPCIPEEAGRELTVDILEFLSKRLSPDKLPRRIEYTIALPRDQNGKIYKRRLRDEHWGKVNRKI